MSFTSKLVSGAGKKHQVVVLQRLLTCVMVNCKTHLLHIISLESSSYDTDPGSSIIYTIYCDAMHYCGAKSLSVMYVKFKSVSNQFNEYYLMRLSSSVPHVLHLLLCLML